ncbi:hypothetical protein EG240_03745 [Paenimyroides tangerinum]|uniref:Uncharacterized protein n=1 Tax=Paenimyroides tangerinum TaxID=2488728 RepID=A0A3P3WD24_9FLAO|nr:hypothetical protein [Paenimyroides tangerinum]RRJ92298.1 hypothetical protein EG240_03745 [Paenimyroides tangerinum]
MVCLENGKRLYRIPPSGVLKTQFKTNTGSVFLKSTENEKERTNEKYRTFNEKFEFYYVDENGNPIKKLNYPIYTSDREFIKPNDYNVFGVQVIIGQGNNEFYSFKKIILYKDTTDLNFIDYLEDKSLEKFYKIHYWDTFDVRKDSVPVGFNWDDYRKLVK